jgi:hypothetical protein
MPEGGLEPPRAEARQILSLLRMPISPLRRGVKPLERNTFQMNPSTALRLHRFQCAKMVQNPFWVMTLQENSASVAIFARRISNSPHQMRVVLFSQRDAVMSGSRPCLRPFTRDAHRTCDAGCERPTASIRIASVASETIPGSPSMAHHRSGETQNRSPHVCSHASISTPPSPAR